MADAEGNRYGPYDIEIPGSEAEAFTEDAWFDLNGHITGVKSGGVLTFAGLTATLTPIDARVHGSYLIREDPWSDASAPTTTASPRRDMLVARRQRTSGEGEAAIPGKTFLTILQGTPAATPSEPTYDDANDEPQWSWQVPGSGGTVATDIRDLRRFHGVPTYAKAWRVGGPAGAMGAGTPVTVDLTHARTNGPITFDAAANCLIIGKAGLYKLSGRCAATGGSGYVVNGRIVRQRASVADKDVVFSNTGHKDASGDEFVNLFDQSVPLQVGDKLLLKQIHSVATGAYYGGDECVGVSLSAEYVGPLGSATPV